MIKLSDNWLGFQMPPGVIGHFGGHALDAK
jgi:hypothetical protein